MEEHKGSSTRRILGIVAFGVILYVGLQHLDVVGSALGIMLGWITPFIIGGCLAFILSVPMRQLERMLFPESLLTRRPALKRLRRPVSLALALLVVVGILLFTILLVVPEIVRAITLLVESLPRFFQIVVAWIQQAGENYPHFAEWAASLSTDWETYAKGAFDWLQKSAGGLLSSTFGIASSMVSGVIQVFLATVFAMYLLMQKEKLAAQSEKLVAAYLPEKAGAFVLRVASLTNRVFSGFVAGQCLEAVILGTMFFLTMTLFRFPYALMIGVLIGVTALVPMVGAFIGCFVGALLILIISPVQAAWFLLMFLVLQQIEGNFIYPHVVAGQVGLPSMWVLVAVTLGGNVMGVAGMLLFIPLCSVLYALLRDATERRLLRKRVASPAKTQRR